MIYTVQCNDGKSATCGRPCVRQHPSPASSEPLAGLPDSGPGTSMACCRAGPGDGAASSRSYRDAPFCCLPASLAATAPPRILISGTPARTRRKTPIRHGSPDAASRPHHKTSGQVSPCRL